MSLIKETLTTHLKTFYKKSISNLGYLLAITVLIVIGSYFSSKSVIMFHNVIRLVSLLISLMIFSTSFYTHKVSKDKEIMFLGIAYLFIAYFIFSSLYYSYIAKDYLFTNQLDLAVLYLQSLSFLLLFSFSIFSENNYSLYQIIGIFMVIVIIIIVFLINKNHLPTSPIDNADFTPLMRIRQYVILGMQGLSLILIFTYKIGLNSFFRKFITTFLILSIISDFLFIISNSTNDFPNILGNILRLISLYTICRMVLTRSIILPYMQLQTSKEELKVQKSYFELLFGDETQAVVMLDTAYKITKINKGFYNVFKYTEDEVLGRTLEELIVPNSILTKVENYNCSIGSGGNHLTETTRKCKDGSLIDVSICGYPIIVDNESIGTYAIYRDITERKTAQKELVHLSFHDSLTGIYNRVFLEAEIKRMDIESQLPLSIIIGDVDGLKFTNDIFGHDEGDKLLLCISEILKNSCRTEDVMARTGNDEFIIFLPKTSAETALVICDNIKNDCIKSSCAIIQPHISLGTSTKIGMSQDIQKLLNRAEDKMYRTKKLDSKNIRNSIINALKISHWHTDNKTEEHAMRIEKLSMEMGQAIGLSESNLEELCLLARIHDLGKLAIPHEILNKAGKLTNEEWSIMKKHSEIGYRIAQFSQEMNSIADGILYHHEKWDGTGYPEGLKDNEIPLLSRIISVIDSYDAMTNDRIYQKAMSQFDALKEIKRCSKTQFDPKISRIFIEIMCKQNSFKLSTNNILN